MNQTIPNHPNFTPEKSGQTSADFFALASRPTKGTRTDRFFRLLGSLSRNPRHGFKYLRYLPVWGRQPVDIEIPWFSFGAIEFLENHIQPHHRVFEFGCGGSSFFFASRAGSVLSVENDESWHKRIMRLAAKRNLRNFRCELHPIDLTRPDRYTQLSYFTALKPLPYDVIVVDGFFDYATAQYRILRHISFDRALACVRRPGGIIVVDDYWMFPEMAARAPDAKITVFESSGPCRYGVTSTAIFQW